MGDVDPAPQAAVTGQASGLQQVAALVGYDGTRYAGFQVQAAAPTIQGVLESSLRTFTTFAGRIAGAGRTDAGVHARGQVIGVRVEWRHDLAALQRAWNVHLPPDVVIRQVAAAPVGFHPRFSALQRTYRYQVRAHAQPAVSGGRDPLFSRFAHEVQQPLKLAALQQAATLLVGRHDFATFGRPPQGESTERVVTAAYWQQVITEPAPLLPIGPVQALLFTISANAFLQHMVRKVVGSLLEVGSGRWQVSDFAAALAAADGKRSAPPAPACGLVLEAVEYPAAWRLFAEPSGGD